MRGAFESAASCLRDGWRVRPRPESKLNPKGKLYAFPSPSLAPRAPPSRTQLLKYFWRCSLLLPFFAQNHQNPSKNRLPKFNFDFVPLLDQFYPKNHEMLRSKSTKILSKITFWAKIFKNRKTFKNHSFYNVVSRSGLAKSS